MNTSKLAPDSRCSSQPQPNSCQISLAPWSANLFLEQARQLLPAVVYPLAVRRIHHPHERVRLLKVVFPVRSQRLLPADVPCAVSLCYPSAAAAAAAAEVQYICSVYIFSHHQPLAVAVVIATRITYPSYSMVLMMKPSVGLTLFTSSPMIFFTIVVFPALSKPLVQSALNRCMLASRAPTTSESSSPCPLDVLFAESTALLLFVTVLPGGGCCCWWCRVNFAAI